ncbi:unknown [Bacteroides sp. CAG:598]|nr:unknown [Bacteroides sp. CAG:598]
MLHISPNADSNNHEAFLPIPYAHNHEQEYTLPTKFQLTYEHYIHTSLSISTFSLRRVLWQAMFLHKMKDEQIIMYLDL